MFVGSQKIVSVFLRQAPTMLIVGSSDGRQFLAKVTVVNSIMCNHEDPCLSTTDDRSLATNFQRLHTQLTIMEGYLALDVKQVERLKDMEGHDKQKPIAQNVKSLEVLKVDFGDHIVSNNVQEKRTRLFRTSPRDTKNIAPDKSITLQERTFSRVRD